ncbi:3-hydroxyacyl-CoA dehydrogenase family protein [Pseudomonas aeruginosa]|uniref:3-hydroxyacyl-CoA dehydrogenase family protein n=1 Tax=Pseudomonas aeruginosa TaxID=287 RepID=UPI000AB49F52|nr:3-hydroxyacyl-CoA dehydrogenase family protein [Pseudomonas aeruginosa]
MRTAYARSVPSFLAACALLCCTALPALAAAWKPEENLEIVVAGGPGGGTDQLARLVQSAISQNKLLDVNTVVLNKGGGNGAEAFLDLKLAKGNAHKLVIGTNNVYLLPLVEVVGGERTAAEAVRAAMRVYESLGMRPLHVRKEVPGFIADRLLEALWREALHLVNDGVATTGEIDDAIRFGAGLRWSFMGTFLTYTLAGGNAGMRHFMAQFGPALQLPWTYLPAPELTEALIDRVVEGTAEQQGARSIAELERYRDDCLLAVLGAIRETKARHGFAFAE